MVKKFGSAVSCSQPPLGEGVHAVYKSIKGCKHPAGRKPAHLDRTQAFPHSFDRKFL